LDDSAPSSRWQYYYIKNIFLRNGDFKSNYRYLGRRNYLYISLQEKLKIFKRRRSRKMALKRYHDNAPSKKRQFLRPILTSSLGANFDPSGEVVPRAEFCPRG
jgi:hypothetical protein